jgi:hypothetical protein
MVECEINADVAHCFVAQASEPEWQQAKIDFHIPFWFSLLLKRINLRASTENASCGKRSCHTGSSACGFLSFQGRNPTG